VEFSKFTIEECDYLYLTILAILIASYLIIKQKLPIIKPNYTYIRV